MTTTGTSPTSPGGGSTASTERTENEIVIRVPTFGRLLRAFLPEEAVQHLYAARREQLLAVRSMLDAAIARLEEDAAPSKRVRRTEIRVE